MRSPLSDWLQGEPVPPLLHARVMGDPRLRTRSALGFHNFAAVATAALVLVVLGGGLATVLLRGNRPSTPVGAIPSPQASASTAVASPSPSEATPSPSPAAVQCHTADLSIGLGQSSGAAGTRAVPVNVTNHGASTCTLQGYFGMAFLDASGGQVGPTPMRDTGGYGSTPHAGPVTLSTGGGAMFFIHWSDVQNTPQPCPAAAQVEFTAPNQVDHVFVPARTADGTVIAPCSPGPTGLTAVQPGA